MISLIPFKISAVIKTVLFGSNIIKGIILKIPKKFRILFVSLNDHGGKEKISIKAMLSINPTNLASQKVVLK